MNPEYKLTITVRGSLSHVTARLAGFCQAFDHDDESASDDIVIELREEPHQKKK